MFSSCGAVTNIDLNISAPHTEPKFKFVHC